jgi:hypothetical protein
VTLIKDWGVTGYYNAMVLSVEETDNSGTDALKVHIFKLRGSTLILQKPASDACLMKFLLLAVLKFL